MGMPLSIDEFWEDATFKGYRKKEVVAEAKKDIAILSKDLSRRQGIINKYEDSIQKALKTEEIEDKEKAYDEMVKILKTALMECRKI